MIVSVSNAKVAELLQEYARALSLEGVDRFKVKAYRRAADTLESLREGVSEMVARGEDLQELPGIGKAISAKIEEIIRKGKLPQLERSVSKLTPELRELMSHPALNPQKVMQVYKKLGIHTLAELRASLDTGAIREALGPRMDFHIRQGLEESPRMLLWTAEQLAQSVEDYLRDIKGVDRVTRVGSLRRKEETVGDLNFLFSAKLAARVFEAFRRFGAVQSSEPGGEHAQFFKLSRGRNVSLAWSPHVAWGLESLIRTGSNEHVRQLRAKAAKRNITLTVKGLGGAASEEAAVYTKIGLDFVEPELREGHGEIEAAAKGALPRLVTLADLRGDLHMHTIASDGSNSILEMAEAAQTRGYEYIAITDHSQSLKITHGLSEDRLRAHVEAIDKLNERLKPFVILKSAEVDILEDGKLDYSPAALRDLDMTICSIHSRFGLNKRQQTERILRAMDNKYFHILGHPTGRLLLTREGYELDMERIVRHAADRGCYFEINSSPNRLDLSDEHARLARHAGIKIAVNTDAHSVSEFDFISAGLNQARRGWLEPSDVLNAYPLQKLKRLLRR